MENISTGEEQPVHHQKRRETRAYFSAVAAESAVFNMQLLPGSSIFVISLF